MSLTMDEVAATLKRAGFKLTALHQTVVVGERPIPGHPMSFRVAHVHAGRHDDWKGVLHWKRLRAGSWTEHEYAPLPLAERDCIASDEHLGLWLGGACSIPVDDAEVLAIMRASEVEPGQRIERVA